MMNNVFEDSQNSNSVGNFFKASVVYRIKLKTEKLFQGRCLKMGHIELSFKTKTS